MLSSIKLFLFLAALLLLPSSVNAQQILFLRAGVGSGTSPKAAAHLGLRFPISDRFGAVSEIGVVATPVVCEDSSPQSSQCNYDGWLATAGVSGAVINAPRFKVSGSGTAGLFHRSTSLPGRSLSPSTSVGLNAGTRVATRVWLDFDVRQFWIRDSGYHDLFAEYPHIRTFTVGVGITL